MTNTYPEEESRRANDYRRLRTHNPICVGCSYCDHPAAMELAHIIPRKFDDDAVVLCSNCHRKQSDAEKDYSYEPTTGNPLMETYGRYILSVADFLKLIASKFEEIGHWMLEQAQHVLPHCPEETA